MTSESEAGRIAAAGACVFRVLEGQSLCVEWSDEVMMSVALRIVAALRAGGFIDLPEGCEDADDLDSSREGGVVS